MRLFEITEHGSVRLFPDLGKPQTEVPPVVSPTVVVDKNEKKKKKKKHAGDETDHARQGTSRQRVRDGDA